MKKSTPPRTAVNPFLMGDVAERLDASTERAKTASRDLHAAMQEGRELIREINALIDKHRTQILAEQGRIDTFMDAAVAVQIASLSEATANAIADAVTKVGQEFDKLAAIYIDEDTTTHEDSLRALFERRAKLDNLIGKPVMIATEAYMKDQVVVDHQGFEFTMGQNCRPLDVLYPHRNSGKLYPGPPI